MSAPSSKPLFQAIKRNARVDPDAVALLPDLPEQRAPRQSRDPLDYDPTPWEATAAFLATEGDRVREIGGPVWEPAVGGGHMAREIARAGFDVIGTDVVDRGWPGTRRASFYDIASPLADIIVTNPPYCEINARDGHGRWLKHVEAMGVTYCAMLLNWDWIAARINGMDELHERFPVSRAYVCTWKIDFTGGGSPPQRNGWLVWDRAHTGPTTLHRLHKDLAHERQEGLDV